MVALYLFRKKRWLNSAAEPAAVQQNVLSRLLDRAGDTWFGRQHGFRSIRTHADFAKAVPIRTYTDFQDLVGRMKQGEPDVTWPGRTLYFARTSGTTAGEKQIPVSRQMIRNYWRANMALFALCDLWERHLFHEMLGGRLLLLGSSTSFKSDGRAIVGDMTAILSRSMPSINRMWVEPGRRLTRIEDWEPRVEAIARQAAWQDIRFLAGAPTWSRVLLEHICLARGIDAIGGISRIWPNLRVYAHWGMPFEPHRPSLARYFADERLPHCMEAYAASEAFIAVQARPDQEGLAMFLNNGVFFEFVPLEEWGRPDARRLTIDEVELDVPYCMVLSTCSGLWAYDLGDMVRFVQLRPPCVVFAGRHMQCINGFDERVIGEEIARAIAVASAQTQAVVNDFTVAPRFAGGDHTSGAHQYAVEFGRPPGAGLVAFAQAIDAEMRRLNKDYAIARGGLLCLGPPEVIPLPPGTFYQWMKRRGQLGGQHKVPICANDRRYIEDLLAVSPAMTEPRTR